MALGRAIVLHRYGAPEELTLEEKSLDDPGPGEVRVRIVASPVNRADCEIRSGKWPILSQEPFPYIPGIEAAGVVEAVGSDVDLAVGTPVITMMQKMAGIHGVRPGGYQSHLSAPADCLAIVPGDMDLTEIAALGLAAVTAYHGVGKLRVRQGDRVLVQGATGGVGAVATRLAINKGAHTIVTARTSQRIAELKTLGAHEVWDLSKKPLSQRPKVNAILEMVGGEKFGESVQCLAGKGRLCSVGAIGGDQVHLSIWDLLQDLVLTGWSSENLDQRSLQKSIDALSLFVRQGVLRPPPIQTFPLEDAAKAHALMESGGHFGRLILLP